VDHAKIAEISFVSGSPASVYANPSGKKTFLRGIVLHNTDTASQLVKLYLVPDATGALGAAALSNRFASPSIPSGDTLMIELPYPFVMADANDSLQAEAAAASKVTILPLGDTEAI
jgi:hypothetical protein